MKTVGKDILDKAGCDKEGCSCTGGPIYMHGRCHPQAAVQAYYYQGIMFIECAECRTPIVPIQVADQGEVVSDEILVGKEVHKAAPSGS